MASQTRMHIERAINQIIDKGSVPTIDFTQHVADDGSIIHTQERAIKEVTPPFVSLLLL